MTKLDPDLVKWFKYVVHCKKEPYDVYVGRPSIWGNNWSHLDGTLAKFRVESREEAIIKYEEWIMSKPDMIALAKEKLKNKILSCHCKPSWCHALILAKIANS